MNFKKVIKRFGLLVALFVAAIAVFLWQIDGGDNPESASEVASEQNVDNENADASDQSDVDVEAAEESAGDQSKKQEAEAEKSEPVVHEGVFELPIEGAAGYGSIEMPLYTSPSSEAEVQTVLSSGSAFEILLEDGNWWKVQTPEATGWIQHKYAFINLPDVIPSIVYDNTNSYDAQYTSSQYEIPGLTNQALYQAYDYNERFEEELFIMPILYSTAKKVNVAQQLALDNGESLKIYETYRPYKTQQQVVETLSALAQSNSDVWKGLNRGPWSQGWFIITGEVSNHQVGAAMDVSLVSVNNIEETVVGDYIAPEVTDYTELEMQTSMHELSADSVAFKNTVPNDSKTAWQDQPLSDQMTEGSIRLQEYLAEAGFSPIASEWWHFNDLDAVESLGEASGTGDFQITQSLNSPPEREETGS